MAVLPSPLSNSIQGINESTVSGSVFGGNKPDPETKSTLQSLSSSVASLQSQVNELSKNNITNIGVFANFQQSFANQIDSIRLQLNKVDDTLESVATIIASESAIEKQKDLYEQEKEKRLAEAGARGGKESLLETKIQNALSEPINRIGNKVSFGFQNLMSFIGTLLGGWLTLEGIKTIKAYQDGDKKQLNEIKDSVIKTLGIAGGIFLVINLGIGRVIGTIFGLAGKIGKFVIANTLGKLFQGMASLAKGVTRAVTGGAAKEAEAGTKAVTSGAEKGAGEGLLSGITKGFGKIAKTGFNLALGGFDFMERKKEGQTNIQAGAGAAGSLATAEVGAKLGSKFPGMLKLPATLIGAGGGYILGGKGVDILTGVDKPKEKEKSQSQPKPKTKVTPTTAKVSQPTDLQFKGDTTKFAFSQSLLSTPLQSTPTQPETTSIPTTTPAKTSTSSIEQTAQLPPPPKDKETVKSAETSSKPSTPKITPAETSKVPTVPFNVGPEPEPKPNIVYTSSGSSNQQPPQQPLKTGTASDVPAIPSSNPDNFYTLYSQINYNVVV
jgi:hypothetical protein